MSVVNPSKWALLQFLYHCLKSLPLTYSFFHILFFSLRSNFLLWVILSLSNKGFQVVSGKEHICQCRRCKRHGFNPWIGKISWRKAWQSTLYSCLRNSNDRGAWQATVHRVAQSQIQLKQTYQACMPILLDSICCL